MIPRPHPAPTHWSFLLTATLALSGCTLFSHNKDKSGERRPSTDTALSPANPAGTSPRVTTPPPPPPVGPLMPPQDESRLDTTHNVVDYAKLCKAELGMPEAVQAPWNCLDGLEIPITVDGQPMDEVVYGRIAAQGGGCDKPSWLGDTPCANYAFVQRRELAPNVTALLLCRERSFTGWKGQAGRRDDYNKDPSLINFRRLFDFDSLGLIWTNTKTGKTCYFDFVGRVFGGYIPSPDDEKVPQMSDMPNPKPPETLPDGIMPEQVWRKNARGTWKEPGEVASKDNCIRCHDSGPFKTSPYIDQVLKLPVNDPTVPYQIVGRVMDPWRQQFPLVAVTTSKVVTDNGAEAEQLCTACHRIGSQATCEQQLAFATGKAAPVSLSAHGSTFFNRMWMPPLTPELQQAWQGKSERQLSAAWSALYDAHVNKMRCCCLNANARGCFRQDLSKSPLPAPVEGTGPADCNSQL